MPILRPYGDRNVHLGASGGSLSKFSQNFSTNNCDVAKYLISKFGDNLVYRNGRKTLLGEHVVECEKCLTRENLVDPPKISNRVTIEIDRENFNRLTRWIRKNHPECSSNYGEAIRLSLEYYEYAYYKELPKLRKYEQKYGEIK